MSRPPIITPRGAVTIRATTADDARPLRALRLDALSDSPTSFGADAAGIDARDWAAVAAGEADGIVFVAEHAGALVGMAGAYRNPQQKVSHYAILWGVFVQPDWRRVGLAQALVDACVEWAERQRVPMVKLTVVPESGALGCYLRCGFRVTGVDHAALQWEGRYYDKLLMHRWLQPNAPGRV